MPTGPSVLVLPGNGKNFDQFQADEAMCRQWALQQTGITSNQAGAAVDAGAGLLGGTAVGAGNAYGADISVQRRYDIASYWGAKSPRTSQVQIGERFGLQANSGLEL